MTIDVDKDVGKNCYLLSVGMQRGLVTVEIDMEASQKKIKHKTITRHNFTIYGHTPKGLSIPLQGYLYMLVC